MKHEKIIKDTRGKVRIVVSLWIAANWWDKDHSGNQFRYDVTVWYAPPGKRKEIHKNVATPDEIHAAKVELWNLIKPI